MNLELIKRLKQPQHDEKIQSLLDKCKGLINRSRADMAVHHETWDRNMTIYKGERPVDTQDLEARVHEEPEKLVVPLSFSQCQAFVTFVYLFYTQNKNFFTLNPTGPEDYTWRTSGETILSRDLRQASFPSILYQFLVDVARFSFGVMKEDWAVEKRYMPTMQATVPGAQLGQPSTVWTNATVFEGNRIYNLSPYYFYPDTRRPLTEWKRGEFAGDEREYSKGELEAFETQEIIAGLEHVEAFEKDDLSARKGSRLKAITDLLGKTSEGQTNHICVTEIQLDIIPSHYDLGPETFPIRHVIWYANDTRVIRIDRYGYAHRQFSYNVAQFTPDLQNALGLSLSNILHPIQDVITWLMNSRMLSVTRNIDGRLIIDPTVIDVESLRNRQSPYVFTKRSAPGLSLDSFVKQLNYTDTTSNHFQDIPVLERYGQLATGVNDNASGQYNRGRRSAAESYAVQSGAAGRMKMHAHLIWSDSMAPLGHKLLLNHRQGLSFTTFHEIIGGPVEDATAQFALFNQPDLAKLTRSEDFFIFNTVLDSEKGFIAQSLQELAGIMLSNPEAANLFQLDVKKLLQEVMDLRGVGSLVRFQPTPTIPNANPAMLPPGLPTPADPPSLPGAIPA